LWPSLLAQCHREDNKGQSDVAFFKFSKSYHPIPWRDSFSRPTVPISLVKAETVPQDHAIRWEFCFIAWASPKTIKVWVGSTNTPDRSQRGVL
jgi:hypothetical protein